MSVGDLLYNVFVTAVYDESASFFDLFKGVLLLALLIFLSFEILKPPLAWLVKGPLKKTMWKIVEVEYNRADLIPWQERYNITSKQEFFDNFIVKGWGNHLLMYTQHLIGGLCAVPAVFGVGNFSASERSSLACLGIMVEMGWEIQDLCRLFYYRVFKGEEGKLKYPDYMVFILLIHHGLTCTMGLPVILAYRHSSEVHQLIFDLQCAAGLVSLFGEATRTLDVKKKNELRMFIFISFLMLLVMVWTRFFHWFYLVYKLMAMFIADKKWTFVFFGGIILTLFSLFNVLMCLIPVYKRLVKFIKKLIEFESLPAYVDESKKRAVSVELEIAASDLSTIELNFQETLMSIFADQKVERRHTFNSAALAEAVATVAASEGVSRRSMVAWRNMPSRVDAKAD